jgi:hypothetical protein
MWYTVGDANTLRCAPAHSGRAGYPGERPPVSVRLHGMARPSAPRQCRRPVDHDDRLPPPRDRADRMPRPSCVPSARSHGVAATLGTVAHPVADLRRRGLRVPPGAAAPECAYVRHAPEPLGALPGGRRQRRSGPPPAVGQRRNHAAGPAPVGRVMATRPTLAHEPRAGLCPQKTGAPG